MSAERLLFASIHSHLNPSSGTALRDTQTCWRFCPPVGGIVGRTVAASLTTSEKHPSMKWWQLWNCQPAPRRRRFAAAVRPRSSTSNSRACELPCCRRPQAGSSDTAPREGAMYLDLADPVFERFRPNVLLTYGGHPVSLKLMHRARSRGIPVVFHLHNFSYTDRRGFDSTSAVLLNAPARSTNPAGQHSDEFSRNAKIDGLVGVLGAVILEDAMRLAW